MSHDDGSPARAGRPLLKGAVAVVVATVLVVGGFALLTGLGGIAGTSDSGSERRPATTGESLPPSTLNDEQRRAAELIECAGQLSPDPGATLPGLDDCPPATSVP